MKRNETVYTNTSIEYWPSYEAGKIGIIYLSVLEAVFVAVSLWILLDGVLSTMHVMIFLAVVLSAVVYLTLLWFTRRMMVNRIKVTNIGIEIYSYLELRKSIRWENVSVVLFHTDAWYGKKSCRIYLKRNNQIIPRNADPCDIVLPVFSVDEKKLLQLIPESLWKNNPW